MKATLEKSSNKFKKKKHKMMKHHAEMFTDFKQCFVAYLCLSISQTTNLYSQSNCLLSENLL